MTQSYNKQVLILMWLEYKNKLMCATINLKEYIKFILFVHEMIIQKLIYICNFIDLLISYYIYFIIKLYSRMSTETCADIFYQVKKQILDKLDLILQKVNLEIINSTHVRVSKPVEDFTFIELSQFQSQISSLFLYLDKLYDSLNSSISGYTSSQAHRSNENLHSQFSLLNEKLTQQNNQLKQQLATIQNKLSLKQKQQQKMSKIYQQKHKKIANRIIQLNKLMKNNFQEINLLKKSINGKLKQYKFQMLQARVEIIAKIKQHESTKKQMPIVKLDEQNSCHSIMHNEIHIINEINQILKMC